MLIVGEKALIHLLFAHFKLVEREIIVSESQVTTGKFANLEIRIPIGRVWLDIQHGMLEIPIEFKKIQFRRNIRLDTHGLGVRYAI